MRSVKLIIVFRVSEWKNNSPFINLLDILTMIKMAITLINCQRIKFIYTTYYSSYVIFNKLSITHLRTCTRHIVICNKYKNSF